MKSELYTRLYLWLSAHRRAVFFATLLVAAASVWISSRIDLDEDILATLPQRDRTVDDYKYTLRKFHQIDRVYIDVGVTNADSETLARAADAVYATLATNSAFAQITYRFENSGQRQVVDFLTGALPNLFTEADAQILASKLETNSVREFLTVMRRKLAGPEGMVLKDVVAADPIGMSSLVLAKVVPLQTGFGSAHIDDGRLVSSDGRHVLLMAEPKFPSSNSGQSAALVDEMLQTARAVEEEFPGVHVAITGGHRMTVDNATLIKSDATRCIFLGLAAMFILCVTAYRRRWLAAMVFLPSLFGTLVAGAALALWDKHLSAIATGFATIAIGITVDYGIYVVYHLENAGELDRKAAGRIVGRLVLPTCIGALTIIAAFMVMANSPMHGYQQLGIFGAIGVLCSAAFALIVLPLLVPLSKKNETSSLWLTQLFENFHRWQTRWRLWLLLVVLALTVVTAFGVKRLRFEGDIAKLNGITESTRADEQSIRETWGDALGMTLVVARGKTVDDALAQNDRAAEILAREPDVTGVYSLATVCPSIATQETNIHRWQQFWTPARCAALRQILQQVGGELGFRADAFDLFWQRLDSEPKMISPETFRGTPLEQALSERVSFGADDNAVSTLVKLSDRSQVGKLRAALPGMIVLDQKNFAVHIAQLAKQGMKHFAVWTGIFVAAIVYFALGSIELVVATLLPLAFGLLWTFGAMGWLGLPINIMNSVFVIFVIGIGEDYSIFLATSKLDVWRGRPPRIAPTSASVLISALTTIFGFAVLIFARHPVLFSMGTTVLLGMVFAFIATMILTPLLMDLLLFREQPRGAPRWWHLLGTIWAALYLAVSQIFLYYILRPLLKIFLPRTADDKLRRATRRQARGLIKSFPFGKTEFHNLAPETFSPPCIIISNHQSAVDVVLMVGLPTDIRQTAKKRIFDTPILGIGCKLLGHVMVEPENPEATLRRCREKLASGASVHFYPEGTRSSDGFVQRFHRGAFELAVEMKQDILPVILCDTNTAMPRAAYWFELYHAAVRALPRVTPQNFDYSQGATALMRHCEKIIRAALQQQLDELNTPRVLHRKVARLYRYQGKFVEQFVHWKMKMDPLFAALDEVVPRQGFILDLGCGYGLATHWLAQITDGRNFLSVDYDAEKIRVAQRTAPRHPRIRFEFQNILEFEFPACDAVLLLDVLHYWTPEKQEMILAKARRALRLGGKLILRDAARGKNAGHESVAFWEKIATRLGHNKTEEGLHFQTQAEIEVMLRRAGFAGWEIKREAERDSNLLWLATAD
ncbi:MAG TPA: 1-acyl-sn-glycerol-3-phosphate acyltransferase [Verrucomicrobiae bacterium]|nr:1-acyl-sn-glycerol-3-phosphate acyltransferase [Verrucomicrobiae bacterium]